MSIFDWWEFRRRAFESADRANRLMAENADLQAKLERAEQQRDEAISKSIELAQLVARLADSATRKPAAAEADSHSEVIESGFENGRAVVQREMAASIQQIAGRLAAAHR